MKRKILRTKGKRFCEVEIEITDGRFSICGTEGRIVRKASAKKEAFLFWKSFFEEQPEEIFQMNRRCGTRFTSATGAARYVLKVDGDLHGIDVHGPTTGIEVMLVESCGQIRETIAEFFPEVAPLLPYHLNDMHAGCEHQDALGWGKGKTIALAAGDLTEAQRKALDNRAAAVCEKKRVKEFAKRLTLIKSDPGFRVRWFKSVFGRHPTLHEVASTTKDMSDRLRAEVEQMIQPEPFDAAIYKDSIGAPCPTCGYEYGTAWLKRELPAAIAELAETVCS
jgi:hypothetical protein